MSDYNGFNKKIIESTDHKKTNNKKGINTDDSGSDWSGGVFEFIFSLFFIARSHEDALYKLDEYISKKISSLESNSDINTINKKALIKHNFKFLFDMIEILMFFGDLFTTNLLNVSMSCLLSEHKKSKPVNINTIIDELNKNINIKNREEIVKYYINNKAEIDIILNLIINNIGEYEKNENIKIIRAETGDFQYRLNKLKYSIFDKIKDLYNKIIEDKIKNEKLEQKYIDIPLFTEECNNKVKDDNTILKYAKIMGDFISNDNIEDSDIYTLSNAIKELQQFDELKPADD